MNKEQIVALKLLRTSLGLLQSDLGKIVNRTTYVISNWENGKSDISCDDLMTIVSYAKKNNVDHSIINKLLGGFCDQLGYGKISNG